MTTLEQPAGQIPGQSKSDMILMMLMLPVYFAVWERFGLKFLAGAGISLITGIFCWLLALINQPGLENRDVAQVPFGWSLFVFFPLFCPLGLPLWLIPMILVVSYLVSISSFGGFGRHFFNPVAFAVIFMLCGYAGTSSLGASRPLPKNGTGFAVWTAGMPPASPVWNIYAKVKETDLWQSSVSGNLPVIPGNAFPGVLLVISFLFSTMAGRGRVWCLFTVLGTIFWGWLGQQYLLPGVSWLHPLFLGMLPGLMLIAVADYHTLPEHQSEQAIAAMVFTFLLLIFTIRSKGVLSPVFALLLAQIISPLLCDTLRIRTRR